MANLSWGVDNLTAKRYFESIKGKAVAFCGIGRSNLPLIEIFLKHGAKVSVRDHKPLKELGEVEEDLKKAGVTLKLGDGYLENLTEDIIFRTPGMYFYLPELTDARRRGAVVTSEMEVFFSICPCKIYAVTGSDGKTTTSTIISEFLKEQGYAVHLGGNIGKPLLPEIDTIGDDDRAVVELSSFQLISMREPADVAVVTNLAPNHLDVHKDMEEYIDAKRNIYLHQRAGSRTVLNADNNITAGFASGVRGDCWMFSRRTPVERGVYCDGGEIYVNREPVLPIKDILLPGWHNVENYMAAIGAVWGDVSAEAIRSVAKRFAGVEHRSEFVREFDGVRYYNDSIASSPSRTIAGTLSLFDRKIILIAGGYDKHIPYDTLGNVICDRVKTLVLMGSTADKIESAVKSSRDYSPGSPEILRAGNMREAVDLSRSRAKPGDIVSLSPASAAFDLYPNFEVRGKHFKEIVNSLK